MGILNEKCAYCGAKAGIFGRNKLLDGKYVCSKCSADIPSYIVSCLPTGYTFEDFVELKKYAEYSKNELKPRFNETYSYYSIRIDTEHGLYYIEDGIWSDPFYLEMSNIEDFDLLFAPEKYKEGLIGDKVYGKVLFRIKAHDPYFYFETILDDKVKAKAKKSFFGSKVECDNPKGLDEFLLHFNVAWQTSLHSQHEYEATVDEEATELQQALTLFMFDSFEDVTAEQLKAQRNKLIKTFHPDIGTDAEQKYAQKINAAYEILKTMRNF